MPYFPQRTPDPVKVRLDDKGEAVLHLPGIAGDAVVRSPRVPGWTGAFGYATLLDGRKIRDGGTFPLLRLGAAPLKLSTWRLTISKPTRKSKTY